jgi:hypothetical protein
VEQGQHLIFGIMLLSSNKRESPVLPISICQHQQLEEAQIKMERILLDSVTALEYFGFYAIPVSLSEDAAERNRAAFVACRISKPLTPCTDELNLPTGFYPLNSQETFFDPLPWLPLKGNMPCFRGEGSQGSFPIGRNKGDPDFPS